MVFQLVDHFPYSRKGYPPYLIIMESGDLVVFRSSTRIRRDDLLSVGIAYSTVATRNSTTRTSTAPPVSKQPVQTIPGSRYRTVQVWYVFSSFCCSCDRAAPRVFSSSTIYIRTLSTLPQASRDPYMHVHAPSITGGFNLHICGDH